MITIVPTLFEARLSNITFPHNAIAEDQAAKLLEYFTHHPLFDWNNSHNGCEGRADAVCVLLDEWHVPNFKGWVFGGEYLKKNHIGWLKNNWKYHVAAVIPVMKDGRYLYYIIDPATKKSLQLIEDWAASITDISHSYYCMRHSHEYIFPEKRISIEKWNLRNKQNRKWMIQCLAGINSLTKTGKAQLCFKKDKLKNIENRFNKIKNEKPSFLLH